MPRQTMESFAPPKVKRPGWATFIPMRSTRPQFVAHTSIGPAKGAFDGLRNAGILYELRGSEWIERFRWTHEQAAARACAWCGRKSYNLEVEWRGRADGSLMAQLVCSSNCR